MIEMNTEPTISQIEHSSNHSIYRILVLFLAIISIGLTVLATIYALSNYMVNMNIPKASISRICKA